MGQGSFCAKTKTGEERGHKPKMLRKSYELPVVPTERLAAARILPTVMAIGEDGVVTPAAACRHYHPRPITS